MNHSPTSQSEDLISWLQSHADFILHRVSPVLWLVAFFAIMDFNTFTTTWFMPFLGVIAAFLANSVPIGGGIVYIPALALLGVDISLGASFTIATMPFGNGVFGFLRWLVKDPTVIIWESFVFTVLPSWLGSLIAIFILPTPNTSHVKVGFGWLSFLIGVLVLLSIYRGGLRKVFFADEEAKATPPSQAEDTDIFMHLEEEQIESHLPSSTASINTTPSVHLSPSTDFFAGNFEDWKWVAGISFLGGLVLVPNIGIGPALITYLLLVLKGYKEQASMVTGIVTGGWVCILPFFIHVIYQQDVPYALWVMVLPGVYFGAKVSHKYLEFHK